MSKLARYGPILRKVSPQLATFHSDLDSIVDDLYSKIGSSEPKFVDSVQPLAQITPSPATFNVSAVGGVFAVQIVNPQNIQPASAALASAKVTKGSNASLTPVLHNLQSAKSTNFDSASGLTDYGVSTQTYWALPLGSGLALYFRIRSSLDGQNWNPWQLLSGPSGPIAVTS